MTRIGIITDVHADVHALRDALFQIERRLHCEMVICCGDVIDYGLFPLETIALLRSAGVVTIRGNHDRWAISEGRDVSGWDLTPSTVTFLEGLRPSLSLVVDGVAIAVHHARPGDDMNGIYPGSGPQADGDTAYLLEQAAVTVPDLATEIAGTARTKRRAADVLIVGHTHTPMYRACEHGVIINPGALLRSPAADGAFPPKTGGTFGVLVPGAGLFTVYRASDGSVVSKHRRTA